MIRSGDGIGIHARQRATYRGRSRLQEDGQSARPGPRSFLNDESLNKIGSIRRNNTRDADIVLIHSATGNFRVNHRRELAMKSRHVFSLAHAMARHAPGWTRDSLGNRVLIEAWRIEIPYRRVTR